MPGITDEVLAAGANAPCTGRKKGSDRSREFTSEQLDLALEETKADIWEFSPRTGDCYFADRFIASLGHAPDKKPVTATDLAALVHPEDRKQARENLQGYLEGTSDVFESVVRIRDAKGLWKWYLARGRAIEWDTTGFPCRLMGVVIDITQGKLAEEELWAAYQQIAAAEGVLQQQYNELERNNQRIRESEASISGIFAVAPIGIGFILNRTIVRVNDRFCEITGYSPEELMGKSTRFLAKDDKEYVPPEESVRATETQWKRKDGDTRDILLNGAPVDPSDPAAGVVFTAADITEYKKTQKALERAKEKLNFLNLLTSTDIQNKVFTALGYLQLVGAEIGKDGSSRTKELIGKENLVLQKISDSLKFSRTYQDLGFKPPRWQNVNQVFLLAISHLAFENVRRTVALGTLEIFADPLLESVFQVLAENTLTHSRPGTQVSLSCVKEPDGSVTIVYTDDGDGIPPPEKDAIFTPDFQKDRSIGLFLAKEILETTDITIRETGTFGTGVRFEIRVPKGGYRFGDA